VATIRVAGIPGDPCGAVLWTVNFQIKKKIIIIIIIIIIILLV